jgi:hypothetical protein
MLTWIEAHGFETLLMYYLFSAFTGGMPTPADTASVGYRWLFSSLSILNGSIARLVATQMSGTKMGQALTSGPPVSPPVIAKPEAIEPDKENK